MKTAIAFLSFLLEIKTEILISEVEITIILIFFMLMLETFYK